MGLRPLPSSDPASRRMRAVRQYDTAAEMTLRRVLHRLGARYRLHQRQLPGTPDLVFPRARIVVFIHGCFWHRHAGCGRASMPKSNRAFWSAKFKSNFARDTRKSKALRADGWAVSVMWECQIERDAEGCARRVLAALDRRIHPSRS